MHYDRLLTRQQVFQHAFTIEQAADEMSREVHASERAIERLQASQAASAKDQAGIEMTLEDGSRVVIDEILNTQYETLKWIENAAADLRYMTEDVTRKVEESVKTQEYLR